MWRTIEKANRSAAIKSGHCATSHTAWTAPRASSTDPSHRWSCGPRINSAPASSAALPTKNAIARAASRLRTKPRVSLWRSYATLSAEITVLIAFVIDHAASPRPTRVRAIPVDGRSLSRRRLSPNSVAASEGAMIVRRSTRCVIVASSATSVNTPSRSSSIDGIAKNALYASGDAISARCRPATRARRGCRSPAIRRARGRVGESRTRRRSAPSPPRTTRRQRVSASRGRSGRQETVCTSMPYPLTTPTTGGKK